MKNVILYEWPASQNCMECKFGKFIGNEEFTNSEYICIINSTKNIGSKCKDQEKNKKITATEKIEMISCCSNCGRKRYKVIREAGGITVAKGTCPICKKEKYLIPSCDWDFMIGKTDDLD